MADIESNISKEELERDIAEAFHNIYLDNNNNDNKNGGIHIPNEIALKLIGLDQPLNILKSVNNSAKQEQKRLRENPNGDIQKIKDKASAENRELSEDEKSSIKDMEDVDQENIDSLEDTIEKTQGLIDVFSKVPPEVNAMIAGLIAYVVVLDLMNKAGKEALKTVGKVNDLLIGMGSQDSATSTFNNNVYYADKAWEEVSENLSAIFKPVSNFLASISYGIAVLVDRVTEWFSKDSDTLINNSGIGWYTSQINGKSGVVLSDVVNTIMSNSYAFKESGYNQTSANNQSIKIFDTIFNSNQYAHASAKGKEDMMSSAYDSVQNGGAKAQYGWDLSDDVFTGWMMDTQGIDIANTQITEAMEQYYRSVLLAEQVGGNFTDDQIQGFNVLGQQIDATKGKLLSMVDEELVLGGMDYTMPNVGTSGELLDIEVDEDSIDEAKELLDDLLTDEELDLYIKTFGGEEALNEVTALLTEYGLTPEEIKTFLKTINEDPTVLDEYLKSLGLTDEQIEAIMTSLVNCGVISEDTFNSAIKDLDKFKDGTSETLKETKNMWNGFFASILSGIGAWIGDVVDMITSSDIWVNLRAMISNTWVGDVDRWVKENILGGTNQDYRDTYTDNTAKSIGNVLAGATKLDYLNPVIRMGHDIGEWVKNIGNIIDGVTGGDHKYPFTGIGHATGGLSMSEHIASISEDNKAEVILPLESQSTVNVLSRALSEAGAGGNNSSNNITVNIPIDSTVFMDDMNARKLSNIIKDNLTIEFNRMGVPWNGA